MRVDSGRLRRLRREAAAALRARDFRSWRYADDGFDEALAYLLDDPAALGDAEVIWRTPASTVWKRTLPDGLGGETVVFKESRILPRDRRWRHWWWPLASKARREAVNYSVLRALDFPVAGLRAAGERREGLRLRDSFIVTRFAEGFRDGGAFMAGGERAGEAALRGAFVDAAVACLARMHALRFHHQGSRPYNFLWRADAGPASLRLCLIDFATGHFHGVSPGFERCVDGDLGRFFDRLGLADDALEAVLARYVALNPACRVAPRDLVGRVRARFLPEKSVQPEKTPYAVR